MAGRVFRQTRISTVIIFVHSGDAHLARLRIHQKSIGHRHVLLRRVLDPRELGHRFASRDVAHDGELLLLDGFEAFGQVTDARFDLHLDPDVALDQLTGLDDGRATSVNAVVRFVDVANEETAGFDDISAARLNLYIEGWVAKVKWLFGVGGWWIQLQRFIAKCKVWVGNLRDRRYEASQRSALDWQSPRISRCMSSRQWGIDFPVHSAM